jgi:hypothetical protein
MLSGAHKSASLDLSILRILAIKIFFPCQKIDDSKSINSSQCYYDLMANVNENEIENENDNGDVKQVNEAIRNSQQQEQQQSEEEFLRDYFKLEDGDTAILQFSTDPKKRRRGLHTFDSKKGPQDTMWFMITTPEDPDYEREYRVTSKKLMRAIVNRYIIKGKTLLEISRKGSKQDNTVYRIRAVDEDKVLVITNKDEYLEQLPLQQKRL